MFKETSRIFGLCLAGAVTLAATTARAGVIYQDAFVGTGDLNGSTPSPVDTGIATWSAKAGAFTEGSGSATVTTFAGNNTYNTSNAFLPYSPSATGGISTLTATLAPTTGGGDWLALGFTSSAPTSTAFYSTTGAELWILYSGNGTGQSFFGGNTSNGVPDPGTALAAGTPDTFTMTINSTSGAFSISDTAGLLARTGTLTTSQINAINYVGFAQYQTEGGTASAFTVSTTAPEPATCGLLASGMALLVRRRSTKR